MKFNKTLKSKIQSGMYFSAFWSLLIFLVIAIPILVIAFIPTSSIFSKSVSKDISASIELFANESHSSMNKDFQKTMQKLTIDDIYNLAIENYESQLEDYEAQANNATFSEADFNAMMEFPLVMKSLDDSSDKIIKLSILNAISDFNENIPIKKYLDIDPILVEYKDSNNLQLLCIPATAVEGHGISAYEGGNVKWASLKEIYDQSKSVLYIEDEFANPLATITTSVNPQFIFFIIIPFFLIFALSSLLSLFVITIMTKVSSNHIIRPITQLNKQLYSLSQNDFFGIKDFQFEVKRPPHEIKELMNSATAIMEQMNDNGAELEAQKEELEAQNYELEMQNNELIESRNTIHKQQDQLVRSEKMATLGQISAAIAHEINTPLGAIKSNAQMMTMMIEKIDCTCMDDKNLKMMDKIRGMNEITNSASDRVNEIIKSLKNFSRIDQSEFQDFNVNEGLDSVLVLTSNLWKNKVKINKDYGSLPSIEGYASMLNQVFMNVIVNGIQAIDNEGFITIKTELIKDNVLVTITDTGKGIKQGLLDVIFESGFTTKEINKGTGLGLSISRDIIDKHCGKIYAKSDENGASFFIELPIKQCPIETDSKL
jgi:signal transduction histidine kinase